MPTTSPPKAVSRCDPLSRDLQVPARHVERASRGWDEPMRLPRQVLSLVPLLVLAATACDRGAPPETPATTAATASAPLGGITPKVDGAPAASDRPGAVADGAIEAGQAKGGAVVGKPAEPTAGDGSASAPETSRTTPK